MYGKYEESDDVHFCISKYLTKMSFLVCKVHTFPDIIDNYYMLCQKKNYIYK